MDSSIDQQSPVAGKINGLLAGLYALRVVLNWAVDMIRLTKEELSEAGVYLDDKYTHN